MCVALCFVARLRRVGASNATCQCRPNKSVQQAEPKPIPNPRVPKKGAFFPRLISEQSLLRSFRAQCAVYVRRPPMVRLFGPHLPVLIQEHWPCRSNRSSSQYMLVSAIPPKAHGRRPHKLCCWCPRRGSPTTCSRPLCPMFSTNTFLRLLFGIATDAVTGSMQGRTELFRRQGNHTATPQL